MIKIYCLIYRLSVANFIFKEPKTPSVRTLFWILLYSECQCVGPAEIYWVHIFYNVCRVDLFGASRDVAVSSREFFFLLGPPERTLTRAGIYPSKLRLLYSVYCSSSSTSVALFDAAPAAAANGATVAEGYGQFRYQHSVSYISDFPD